MEKIITVDLKGCKKAFANPVTQWDYGYKLHINGLSDFGGSVEVHFSFNEVGGEAERSIAEVTETGVIVEFPNWLLEREHNGNYYAYAFIYPATADAGQTIKTIVFPVMGRPKPADWTKKNDPDVIAQLNEKIEKKADKAATLSGYGIKDAYTKTEIDNLIGGAGYTKKEIDSFLSEKVDKVEGKDLSSNDFTDELKAKLENAASKDDLEGAKTELNKNIAESEARASEKAIAETKKEANNLYANAIKATASGEVIRVDDVSPAEHTARAKVSGKNLIPYPYRDKGNSKNGGTFIVQDDGGVLVSGTPTDYISLTVYNGAVLATEGLITVSITGVFDNVAGDFVIKNEQGETIASVGLSLSTATKRTINLDDYPTAKNCTLILKRANNNKEMNGVVYPQIERGDTATEYEPYIPPESVIVTRCGKNLYEITKASNFSGFEGVEFALVNGGVSLNGTLTNRYMNIKLNNLFLPVGSYVAKTTLEGTYPTIFVKHFDGTQTEYGQQHLTKTPFNISVGDEITHIQIRAKEGESFSGICYFQIECGTETTDFEIYNGTTYTPEADGTVSIDSLAPTMTLLTDTPGVNIELVYNQDANKALGNMKSDIAELDKVTSELPGYVDDSIKAAILDSWEAAV